MAPQIEYMFLLFVITFGLEIVMCIHVYVSFPVVKKMPSFSLCGEEWTNSLIKFLKEQLGKLVEFYNQPYSNMSMQRLPPETETALKQWEYGIRLSGWLLEVCQCIDI